MRVTKHQRQHRIAKLLEAGPVTNQAQLVELLAAEGVEATQTTVSRDLEELGAVKVRLPGGRHGVRPARAAGPADRAERAPAPGARGVGGRGVPLGQPGRAAHAAGVCPRRGLGARPQCLRTGVLGTVAGDDTVLVVVAEGPEGGPTWPSGSRTCGIEPSAGSEDGVRGDGE